MAWWTSIFTTCAPASGPSATAARTSKSCFVCFPKASKSDPSLPGFASSSQILSTTRGSFAIPFCSWGSCWSPLDIIWKLCVGSGPSNLNHRIKMKLILRKTFFRFDPEETNCTIDDTTFFTGYHPVKLGIACQGIGIAFIAVSILHIFRLGERAFTFRK